MHAYPMMELATKHRNGLVEMVISSYCKFRVIRVPSMFGSFTHSTYQILNSNILRNSGVHKALSLEGWMA